MRQQRASQTKAPEANQQAIASRYRQPSSSAYDAGLSLLQLHSIIGNRAMGRMLQTKLKVNEPGDEYEQEADRVAEQVMRMPEPGVSRISNGPNVIQRRCAVCASGLGLCPKCAEEERNQRKALASTHISLLQKKAYGLDGTEQSLQTKEASGQASQVTPQVAANIDGLRGRGRPLPQTARAFFEPRFGMNLSGVRVHTDSLAAQLAQAVNARAFTVGRDVVFGLGEYAPETNNGQRLLAHELAHVVQQRGTIPFHRKPYFATGEQKRFLHQNSEETSKAKFAQIPHVAPPQPLIQRLERQCVHRPTCTARQPESCATYEEWLCAFTELPTFTAWDTTPRPRELSDEEVNEACGSFDPRNPTCFQVIGEERAIINDPAAPAESRPPVPIGPRASDRFIDRPTDNWVQENLPEELRQTAYRLPADCADIAVILRHVWLFAHGRTEHYGGWVVGSGAGRSQRGRVEHLRRMTVDQIFSGNVQRVLNPYTDQAGRPLRTFAELQNLLHPGDILVWEHHEGGLGTPRTGGDTESIMDVLRDESGNVIQIKVVQGNQPIFEQQARAIRREIGRGAPSERTLQSAGGRRLEVHILSGSNLRDLDVPQRRGSRSVPQKVWTLADGHTTLVAAGPTRAAPRPAISRRRGQPAVRRISDWLPPLRRANLNTLQGVFEAALLEMRAMIEGGQNVADADAVSLGQTAGQRLWNFSRHSTQQGRGALDTKSYFDVLHRMRAMVQALGGIHPERQEPTNPNADQVREVFELIDNSFNTAARGSPTITFRGEPSL